MQNIQVNSSPLVNGDLGSLTLKRLGNLLTAWMQMDYSVKQSDIEQKLIGNSTGRKVLAGRCWTMRRCGCLTWTKGICLFLWWTNQMEQGWISGQGLGFILPLTFVFLVNVHFGQCQKEQLLQLRDVPGAWPTFKCAVWNWNVGSISPLNDGVKWVEQGPLDHQYHLCTARCAM